LVDDGIATGNTLLSSIELIQNENPSEIIVAIPVASQSALKKISEFKSVNKIICLLKPNFFQAVGQFYEEFYQVSDEEVIKLLKIANENFTRQ
jgi:predicted phosphoribosyltransferase